MRSLTANIQNSVDQALAVEPMLIIRIDWASGTVYYSEKTFTLGALSIKGQILSVSSIDNNKKDEVSSDVSSISITLDDTDGSLKTLINTEVIEGKSATVYHYYSGNTQSDILPVLKGKVVSDIVWSEGERSLSFSIETFVQDDEVGFSLEEDDITNQNPEAVDVPWPMCFGTVINVPAVRVRKQPIGSLRSGINQNYTEFEVENGEEFPQDTTVEIKINNMIYEGTFNGSIFTVTTANKAHHTNIDMANRPLTDPNYNDATVAWLDEDVNIVGLYCLIQNGSDYAINKCVKQVDKKCWFEEPWGVHSEGVVEYFIVNGTHTIEETAAIPRSTWSVDYIKELVITQWPVGFFNEIINVVAGAIIIARGKWYHPDNSDVRLVVTYKDLYVANLFSSVEILDVFGYRSVDGVKTFTPIPSSYYTKTLSDSLAGETPTTLEFDIALEEYEDEGWDGSVYVSLRSSKGSNVSDIISFLLTTYSNQTPDSDSFAEVAGEVGIYPANFAYFDRPNVLSFIEDIAWQSRCAVIYRNGNAIIKYLSKEPITDLTIDESDVELKSLVLTFIQLEDLITKLKGNFVINYSGKETAEKELIYRNNIDTYGLHEKEINFFIYTYSSLVKLSLYWWGYRLSNSWRKVSFASFLRTLAIEPFDIIASTLNIISTNTIRGIVEDINHDNNEHSISLNTLLASKAGDSDSGQPVEDSNFWLGDPSYSVDIENNPITVPDPGANREETDQLIPNDTDDGLGGDTSGGQTGAGEPIQNTLYFAEQPEEVERGVNFTLRVEIRDSNGSLVNVNGQATLILTSSDGSDVLNTSSITIVGGVWESSSVQITGGSGRDDVGSIGVSSPNFQNDTTLSFLINDSRISLTPGTIPNITRGAAQSSVNVATGGTAASGDKLEISLNSGDSNDKIYDSGGTEITQLTEDGSGNFALPVNWYISGGNGSVTGEIFFSDTIQNKYASDRTNQFTISGATAIKIEHTLGLSSQFSKTTRKMTVEVADNGISNLTDFELTVKILDASGSIDTSYNGVVQINLKDGIDNNDYLNWSTAGPNATVYGKFILANIVNGQWSYDECKVEVQTGFIPPIKFVSSTQDGLFSKTIEVPYSEIQFLMQVDTTPIGRSGTPNFNLFVQAVNPDGDPITSYVPTYDPDIDLINKSDSSDVISPSKMGTTGWVNGAKTVACNINGGSGSDFAHIRVRETDGITVIRQDTVNVAIGSSYTQYPFPGFGFGGYSGCAGGTGDIDAEDPYAEWLNAQANALADLENAINNILSNHRVYLSKGTTDPEYNVHFGAFHNDMTLTAANISGAKAADMNVIASSALIDGAVVTPNVHGYLFGMGLYFTDREPVSRQELINMPNDIYYSFSHLDQLRQNAGVSYSTPFIIPIDVDLLSRRNAITDKLHIWFRVYVYGYVPWTGNFTVKGLPGINTNCNFDIKHIGIHK